MSDLADAADAAKAAALRLSRTIAAIRAGKVARLTQTELLEVCDAAERASPPRVNIQMTDEEVIAELAAERDEARTAVATMTLQINDLMGRLSRVRAAADGRP